MASLPISSIAHATSLKPNSTPAHFPFSVNQQQQNTNLKTFSELKFFLENLKDNSTHHFSKNVVLANGSINVRANGVKLYFNGLKIERTAPTDFVIRFSGRNNHIHDLNVDGGLNRLGDKRKFKQRNVAILDSGSGNRYISCSAGMCPFGNLASGWELNGRNTVLQDCVARESGARNFRIGGDGIRCQDCSSYHTLDRPKFERSTLRRHFSGVATANRNFRFLLISGGKWVSDYQWTSAVFDADGVPGGKIQGGSLEVLKIEDVEIEYGKNTRQTTGNRNVSVAKFDGIKQVELTSITENHHIPNVMFANVSSGMNLLITSVNSDGFIGFNHSQKGGAGGHLRIKQCMFGEHADNKSAVSGFQTNSPAGLNSIESAKISDSWFRVSGGRSGIFWNASSKMNFWQLNNVTIDHVGTEPDYVWKEVNRFGQISLYNVAITGRNRSKVFLAKTPVERLAASAESSDRSLFRYDYQVLRYHPKLADLGYGKAAGLSSTNEPSASSTHPAFPANGSGRSNGTANRFALLEKMKQPQVKNATIQNENWEEPSTGSDSTIPKRWTFKASGNGGTWEATE